MPFGRCESLFPSSPARGGRHSQLNPVIHTFCALSPYFGITQPTDALSTRFRSGYTIRMKVFVFISAKDWDVLGFTADQVGANLPREYAPWTAATEGGAVLVHDAESETDADIVLDGIRRDGFFMAIGGYEDEPLPLSLRAFEPDPIHHRLLPSLLVH
jgi:hypothetical protein